MLRSLLLPQTELDVVRREVDEVGRMMRLSHESQLRVIIELQRTTAQLKDASVQLEVCYYSQGVWLRAVWRSTLGRAYFMCHRYSLCAFLWDAFKRALQGAINFTHLPKITVLPSIQSLRVRCPCLIR
jgi:hypothetical protein